MATTKILSAKENYINNVRPTLMKDFDIKNINAVSKIEKITVNVGIGSILQRSGDKKPNQIVENITKITGQKPIVTKARKSVSNFKLREGMPNGVVVTLRGPRMYDFLDKLTKIIFPRIRDFQGISSKSFDKFGNYTVGLKEHTVFPEINPDELLSTHGLQMTFVMSGNNRDENYQLLLQLGFPFKEAKKQLTN